MFDREKDFILNDSHEVPFYFFPSWGQKMKVVNTANKMLDNNSILL